MAKLYEIVELPDGDIALQREGDADGQPLVTMRFSLELLRFLQGEKIEIAKSMIEAGLEKVAEIAHAVESETYEGSRHTGAVEDERFTEVAFADEVFDDFSEREEDFAYSSIPMSHLLH